MDPATAQNSSARPVCICRSDISAQNHIPQEPTARQSASSKPPCANGPMQNTGLTRCKETTACSPGHTTTTTKDHMVASTTGRPSAAPTLEQPLDHLQVPQVSI